ncbi:MAG: TetR/AcrR family transcriptional regulator [Pelistega sp.]|nr:TetR/AcrR family transcriptional regulator [Pelistega sp.]
MHGNKNESKSEAILSASCSLFYKNGFHATGVDLLASNAGITKKTLYKHFATKDTLISATLAHRHTWFTDRLMTALKSDLPTLKHSTAHKYLKFITDWCNDSTFSGCMFINTCAEFSESDHAHHIQAQTHKKFILETLTEHLRKEGLQHPQQQAKLLFVFGEGLIVAAQTNSLSHEERVETTTLFLKKFV